MKKEKPLNDGRIRLVLDVKENEMIQEYSRKVLALPAATFIKYFLIEHVEKYKEEHKINERNLWF